MDNELLKKMAMMLSKVPPKDLEKNLAVAKNILANSNKEDLNKLINSKEVKNILGKDKEQLNEALKNNNISAENMDTINNFLTKQKD